MSFSMTSAETLTSEAPLSIANGMVTAPLIVTGTSKVPLWLRSLICVVSLSGGPDGTGPDGTGSGVRNGRGEIDIPGGPPGVGSSEAWITRGGTAGPLLVKGPRQTAR